ncbi:hypothetical protein R20943_07117 [Paraburkholderia aspalathi]|nr:hypothetical protein R20943_07117 [Paraburkholderia aspalathi]
MRDKLDAINAQVLVGGEPLRLGELARLNVEMAGLKIGALYPGKDSLG